MTSHALCDSTLGIQCEHGNTSLIDLYVEHRGLYTGGNSSRGCRAIKVYTTSALFETNVHFGRVCDKFLCVIFTEYSFSSTSTRPLSTSLSVLQYFQVQHSRMKGKQVTLAQAQQLFAQERESINVSTTPQYPTYLDNTPIRCGDECVCSP